MWQNKTNYVDPKYNTRLDKIDKINKSYRNIITHLNIIECEIRIFHNILLL